MGRRLPCCNGAGACLICDPSILSRRDWRAAVDAREALDAMTYEEVRPPMPGPNPAPQPWLVVLPYPFWEHEDERLYVEASMKAAREAYAEEPF